MLFVPAPLIHPLQQEFDQAESREQTQSAGIAAIPIGRLGCPKEIAEVALYLASGALALFHGASRVADDGKTVLREFKSGRK